MNINIFKKKLYGRLIDKSISIIIVAMLIFSSLPIDAFAVIYAPGETLNPACAPTDLNCAVAPLLTTSNTSNVSFGPTATTTGGTADLKFLELASNGSSYTGFKSPDSLAANVLYTLPNADGANGQVLSSNGTGALSWITPATGGLTSLNGLATSTQTFAVGTTGTDFGITSSGSGHTFNLPTATGTARGLLASADWTTFNSKVSSQWATSGNNIYYNAGNIGIGTSAPTANLSFGATTATINNAATNGTLTISSNGTGNITLVPGASGIVQIGDDNNQGVFIGGGSFQINTSPQIISLGQILPGASIIREGLRFLEPAYINGVSTTGNNYVGLQSSGVDLATTTVWSLPVGDGTNGQMLATDGAGALSWAISSGASSLAVPIGSNANGGSIASNVLTLSLADGTNPGIVSTSTQTFAGDKTLANNLAVNGNTTLGDASTDRVTINSQLLGANALVFQGATDNTFETTLAVTDPTADRTITIPDASGALLLDFTGFAKNGNSFAGLATLGTNDNNGLAFETNSAERLRIDASGNIGIGTTNPGASLEVTASTTAGTQWTSRSGAIFGNKDVAYGNGIYVAIVDTNTVFTSPDAITWTQRSIPTSSVWRGITYANGIFVAVGSVSGTGTVMTSPDGITWTSRTPSANNNWESIIYGNNIFVATASSGAGNRVMTSPDGITWTSRTSASDDLWRGVTYGNGQFVAVSFIGTTYRVMTSPDGITWTGRTATNSGWNSITYGGGLFVAVGEISPYVMTSPDGITWTDRTPAATNFWRAVTYGNGIFVAVSGSGTGNRVMTSSDGATWTSRTSAEDNNWNGITFGNNLFVAVADSGTNRIMTSSGALPTAIIANGGISVAGSIVPTSNIAYDLGSVTNRFRSLYLSGTTLYIGDQSLSNSSGSLTWSGTSIQATPSATSSTDIKLSELSGNGSNYTGFKSPDALEANVLYTLPSADGTTGQSLVTNGSGGLSWVNSAVGKTSTVHHFAGTALAITTAHNNAEIHAESTGGFTIDGVSFTEDTFGATIVNTGGVLVTLTPSNFVGSFLRDGTTDAGFAILSIEPDTAYKLTVTNNGGSKFLNVIKFAAGGGSSQWTMSGANIYYNTGNVAIGTSTPSSAKLLISGAVTAISTQNQGLISTGGTVTTVGSDTVITYNGSGTFTPPTGVTSVQLLVVAGGGGGGNATGGGGGAGGMRDVASLAVSAATTYTITVGAGGAGGANGLASSFGSLTTTVGGGRGGGGNPTPVAADLGGSGGGGGGAVNAPGGAGTSGEGNTGGAANAWANPWRSGGGGGAGSVGSTASSTVLGNGGLGSSSDITGSAVFYAGGGGGGTYNEGGSNFGTGGTGGGGNGSIAGNGVAGTTNTGGGGGGAGNNTGTGGAGGSGVVIVRFTTVAAGSPGDVALLRVTDTGTVASSTLAFFEGTSGQGCIIAGSTGLSCSSDITLKKNVNALENSLGNVLALNPVTFNWNNEMDGAGSHIGFIAQDVEKIFPGLVVIDPNGKKALSYNRFAPIIVAALQEQYGGMMGINIANIGDMAELFTSDESLDALAVASPTADLVSDPIDYIRERVVGGIKIVRTLVTEKIVAVSGYFKRIFANELCLTDSAGSIVCVTGDALKNLNGAKTVVPQSESTTLSEPTDLHPEGSPVSNDIGVDSISNPDEQDPNQSVDADVTPVGEQGSLQGTSEDVNGEDEVQPTPAALPSLETTDGHSTADEASESAAETQIGESAIEAAFTESSSEPMPVETESVVEPEAAALQAEEPAVVGTTPQEATPASGE